MKFKCNECGRESEYRTIFREEDGVTYCEDCSDLMKRGLTRLSGIITRVSVKGEKYGLQIESEDGKWFNGFGKVPGETGDGIIFWYNMVNSAGKDYFNVKRIDKIKDTHSEPTKADEENFEESRQVALETKTGEGDDARTHPSEVPSAGISFKKEFAMLLKSSVDLCISRGILSDEEVRANYIRFLKLSNLHRDWEQSNGGDKHG